jgi:hypothetical protein
MRPKECTAEALELGQLEPSWGRNILVQDKRPLVNQLICVKISSRGYLDAQQRSTIAQIPACSGNNIDKSCFSD